MSLLDGVVPYGIVPGDHDHESENPDGSTQYYESYFPTSRFETYPWWGAGYNNNTNNYQLMTIGRQDYIFLSLDFCPSQDELDWANGILTTYSDRKAILTTHAFLDENNQYYGSSDFSRYPNGDPNPSGDTSFIWNDLIRNHENLQFVLCGHMHGEARRTDDNLAGKPVHQLLANYQGRPNGGNGWLRIMRFVPLENKVYVQTYSPWLDQYETDSDSQFTLDFPMNSFTVIGTNTGIASGSNASVVWAGLTDGTEYEWFVEVKDTAQHTQVGPTWSFTATNNPQEATNPSPAHGATDVAIETNLGWQAGIDAFSHNVYFGTEPDPRTQQAVNLVTNSYDPGPFNPSTTYYWAVDELDSGGGLLAAGATWSFTTASAPGQASVPNPTDAAMDVPIDAILSWTAGSDTTSHDVYFGEDQVNLPLFSEGQTGTTFNPGSLEYATTYYWRIDEVGPGGKTTGAVWSFTTVPSPPPGQATNPSPEDAAAGVPVDADLSWTAGTGAVSHDVYFGTSDPPEFIQNQPVFTFYDPGTLDEGITYYWRIDEYNIDNVKTEGVLWSFTTVLPTPPEMAIPAAPIDEYGSAVNVSDVGVGVILTWLSGDRAASHDVYFGTSYDQVFNADNTSPEFKGNIPQEDGNNIPDVGTYFTWDPTPLADEDLPYETSYWWRIDEINPGGVTTGPVWNFTTESDTYPPLFAYPPDAVSITAQSATIIWTTNELSDSNVGYSLDTSYGNKVYDDNLVKVHSVTLTGLQPGTTYYYRATSTDIAGNSTTEYPDQLFFTTETLPPELPWSDDFESGDFAVGGWTVVAAPASVDDVGAYTGSYGTHLKKTGTIEKSISTAGYQAIHVKYDRTTNNMKSTEFFFVDWFDGSGWHELETTNDTSWGTVDEVCGVGADNNPSFKVRFRMNGKSAKVEAMVDNVEIFGTPSGPDTNPPEPDPMTWAVPPHATGSTSISMTATTASDPSGVEYYFACITDPAHDSGWQNSPTYEDAGLTTGTEYSYQVQARDKSPNQNETDWSNPASATPTDVPPAPPTGLTATSADSQVSLDWDDNTEQDLVGYNVYRSITQGGNYTQINVSLVLDSDYVDTTVINGTTYYYVVTAIDQALNESGISSEASATPGSQPVIHVESITMGLVPVGKNTKAEATILVYDQSLGSVQGATVVGDWYLNDELIATGSTATTDSAGYAVNTSPPEKAKSGEIFRFELTEVVLSGYIYDPGQSVTYGSIEVP